MTLFPILHATVINPIHVRKLNSFELCDLTLPSG